MSQLHSGTWIGVAVNLRNGNSEKFAIEIKVESDGSFTGTVVSQDPLPAAEREAPAIQGRFSPYGSLHLRYVVDESRYALFDGRFEVPDEHQGVMWGSMSLVTGDKAVPAVASLHFARSIRAQRNGHVWGN